MCSQMGLGPCRLEEIEVLGESIDSVRFDLNRLTGNVLEMPLGFCLDRISLGELGIIFGGLRMYGFVPENGTLASGRDEITKQLVGVMQSSDYVHRALECLPEPGMRVLSLIIERGGTSGGYFDILDTYTAESGESNSFWAGLRSLLRLGLAFIFHGQHRSYVILSEGVVGAAKVE